MTEALRPFPPKPSATRGAHGLGQGLALRIALIATAGVVLIAGLSQARIFAIPTVLAALAAVALAPPAGVLERMRLPAGVAAFVLVFGSLVAIVTAAYAIMPSLEAILEEAPQAAARLEAMAREIERSLRIGSGSALGADWGMASSEPSAGSDDAAEKIVDEGQSALIATMKDAPAQIGAAIYGVFLTFFLVKDRRHIAHIFILAFDKMAMPRSHAKRALQDLHRLLSRYLGAITLINAGLGIVTAAVFHLLGVPSAVAWGAAMMVLNFAPYLGPVVMNAAVLGIGGATFDDPILALKASGALILLNTVEGYMITPAVVGRQVRTRALFVFLAVAFGAWLWGWAGALLATPVLITAQETSRTLRSSHAVSE